MCRFCYQAREEVRKQHKLHKDMFTPQEWNQKWNQIAYSCPQKYPKTNLKDKEHESPSSDTVY